VVQEIKKPPLVFAILALFLTLKVGEGFVLLDYALKD